LATALIANRPPPRVLRRQQQRRFFCPRDVQRLPQDLRFHGLAPEQPLQVADTLLELPHPARGNHVLVGPDRLMPALDHAPLPAEQQARRYAGAPGHERHRGAGLHRLLDEAHLLGGGPAAAALHGGDDFDTR